MTPGDQYAHYKGGLYEIVCEALHTETKESLVVYRQMETGEVFARPKEMFLSKVALPNGKTTFRFELMRRRLPRG